MFVALARSSFVAFEVLVIENAGAAALDRLCSALTAIAAAAENAASALADPTLVGERCVRWRRYRLPGGQPVTMIATPDNFGYGGGVNLAINCLAEAPGWRGLWILNPDTEPEPTALQKVIEQADSGGYGLTGSRLGLRGCERVQLRGGRWRWLIGRGLNLGQNEPAGQAVDAAAVERRLQWVSGAALFATRDFVQTVGPMEERYFLYCEDVDWSLRRGRFRLGYAHESVYATLTARRSVRPGASVRVRSLRFILASATHCC